MLTKIKTVYATGLTTKDLPMSQYKDYPADKIAEKLKRVDEFEAKYKPNTTSIGWRKWCTDPEYRKREWQMRQSVANSINFNKDYR
jgi:hypothetical protein|tara:strand:+ start:54 stop:311 length:258 start_codon:yes stop_codon:yes gene_type:complete